MYNIVFVCCGDGFFVVILRVVIDVSVIVVFWLNVLYGLFCDVCLCCLVYVF